MTRRRTFGHWRVLRTDAEGERVLCLCRRCDALRWISFEDLLRGAEQPCGCVPLSQLGGTDHAPRLSGSVV
jgi:hypothetical protein